MLQILNTNKFIKTPSIFLAAMFKTPLISNMVQGMEICEACTSRYFWLTINKIDGFKIMLLSLQLQKSCNKLSYNKLNRLQRHDIAQNYRILHRAV
jgi:hypothetical protein